MEFSQAKDHKSSKKGFCKYRADKTKTKQSWSLLLNGVVAPVTKDMEKAMVLNGAFTSDFASKVSF